MAKQEPLFDLISSLSQAEKRYFRLFASNASGENEKNYVHLFDLIEKQTKDGNGYDESAIVSALNTKYFAQLKRHTYLKVMECLRSFDAHQSVDVSIATLLHEFEILLQRSLYKQSRKVLQKAKKLAEQQQRFHFMLLINKHETRLLRYENDLDQLEQHLLSVQYDLPAILEHIAQEVDLDQSFVHILKWNKALEFVRNDEELSTLKRQFSKTLAVDRNALSVDARLKHSYIEGLFHFFVGDFVKSAASFHTHLREIRQHPSLIRAQMPTYVRALGNSAMLNLKLEQFDNFYQDFNELQRIDKQPALIQNYVTYSTYMFQLMYFTQVGLFEEAVQCIDTNASTIQALEADMKSKDVMVVERTYVAFNAMNAHLGHGNLKGALRILNDFLNSTEEHHKRDVYCIARLLHAFIHFELGNADLLEYTLQNTFRFLEKRERLYQLETEVMNFIQQALTLNDPKAFRNALIQLRNNIAPLKAQVFERNAFEHFDFLSWLEAHLSEQSFGAVVRQRFNHLSLKRTL